MELAYSWTQGYQRGLKFKNPLTEKDVEELKKYAWLATMEYLQGFIHERQKFKYLLHLLLGNFDWQIGKDEIVIFIKNSDLQESLLRIFQRIEDYLRMGSFPAFKYWFKQIEAKLKGLDPLVFILRTNFKELDELLRSFEDVEIGEIPLWGRGMINEENRDEIGFLQVLVFFEEIKGESQDVILLELKRLIFREKINPDLVGKALLSNLEVAKALRSRIPVEALKEVLKKAEGYALT